MAVYYKSTDLYFSGHIIKAKQAVTFVAACFAFIEISTSCLEEVVVCLPELEAHRLMYHQELSRLQSCRS